MRALASVRIVNWQGASLWLIEATPEASREIKTTDFHAHHAIQVVIGLGGRFKLATREQQAQGPAVAVAADTEHVFEAEGLFALLFIEPESRMGRAVSRALFCERPLVAVAEKFLGDFPARVLAASKAKTPDQGAIIEAGSTLIERLGSAARADAPDLRIRKVIAWAGQNLEQPISLADAVPVSGLSAGRLRHLFVEQTGLPFKTFLLWLRLTKAVEIAATGASLTEAAHEAGFADSAHLSRTFRRMFGVTPAALRLS
jgi:AraC-like DNA-binding protein